MSKSRVVPLWPVLGAAAFLFAAAVIAGSVYLRYHSSQAARLAALESENRQMRLRSESLAREMDLLRGSVSQAPAAAREPAHPGKPEAPDQLEQNRFVFQLRDKLAAATASISSLQLRVQELQASAESAKQDSAKLAASETDLREKLNGANRVLEAVQAELKSKGDRLTQAEISSRLLKDENRALSDKLNRVPPLMRELDEINRRREAYLGNVLRRYKEVTDQYRAISEAAPPSPDVSRINNTISLAEEDLRQLTALNAQAARLRQRLNGN